MRIFHGIEYGDEKEVESLIGDASTDVNWINEAYFVSVILYINSSNIIFYDF